MACCEREPPDSIYNLGQNLAPFLATNGSNVMLAPLGFIPGIPSRPGLYVVGDRDTGIYAPDDGELGVSIDGRLVVKVTDEGLFIFLANYSGKLYHENTANRTYKLPDKSGTLALSEDTGYFIKYYTNSDGVNPILAGMAVYASAADIVTKARANAAATATVIGLAKEQIAAASLGYVISAGYLELPTATWDVITGEVGGLTVGSDYYLSTATAGYITKTAPNVAGNEVVKVGHAVSTTKMFVNVEVPIGL